MGRHFVYINYENLAEHLVSRYDVDNPSNEFRFNKFKTVLDDQVQMMISSDPFAGDDDEELTELLLEHYTWGSIKSVYVTPQPAIVATCKYGHIPLPLIFIELD